MIALRNIEEQENPKLKAYSMTLYSFGGAAAQADVH
jgi:hypothetical protein